VKASKTENRFETSFQQPILSWGNSLVCMI